MDFSDQSNQYFVRVYLIERNAIAQKDEKSFATYKWESAVSTSKMTP